MSRTYVISYIRGIHPIPFAAGSYLLYPGGNYAAPQLTSRRVLGQIQSAAPHTTHTPTQKQSGKPGCFCLRRFEVIALTVCPKGGNCIYNHRVDTGADCCGRSACAYPRLQKQQLAGAIAELLAVPLRTSAQEEKLERYRRYFRELNHRGGDP